MDVTAFIVGILIFVGVVVVVLLARRDNAIRKEQREKAEMEEKMRRLDETLKDVEEIKEKIRERKKTKE